MLGHFGAPNVLLLTRARPVRSGSATHSVARTEPRKRRASERPRIGCCGEFGGRFSSGTNGIAKGALVVPCPLQVALHPLSLGNLLEVSASIARAVLATTDRESCRR